MTQTEMIEKLSLLTRLSKYRLRKIFIEIWKLVVSTLVAWDSISFSWVGKLVKVDTKARSCINPQTLEKINVGANKRIKFKVSSTLKEAIRI